jgi:BirA family biotin operon repressor/biotin-[acetyl-CoA-carboxylase] ligase
MKDLAIKTLKLLADGEFRSGVALARLLGMSRASIWHAVRDLDAAGLDVFRVRGRGYRLAQPLSLLDRDEIVRQLDADAAEFSLEIMDGVSSTNTLALQRAARGAPANLVIAAEWQEAGRGRMGRAWHAGIGGALTFSLVRRFPQGVSFLAGLSLAVGVALARSFELLGLEGVGLKWPNDVLWRGGKLAGILIEVQGDMLGPSTAVIGIGVNVRLSQAVRDRIGQPASDLESACGHALDRNRVLALLLQQMRDALDAFTKSGLAPFRDDWHRYHAHQDKMVTLILPDARLEQGCARGVAEDGALLIETAAGLRRYHSGEISLRVESQPRVYA